MLPGVFAAATLAATGAAAQSLEEITVTARKTTESLQEVQHLRRAHRVHDLVVDGLNLGGGLIVRD